MITEEFERYFSEMFEKVLLSKDQLWDSVKTAAALSVKSYCNKKNILG